MHYAKLTHRLAWAVEQCVKWIQKPAAYPWIVLPATLSALLLRKRRVSPVLNFLLVTDLG